MSTNPPTDGPVPSPKPLLRKEHDLIEMTLLSVAGFVVVFWAFVAFYCWGQMSLLSESGLNIHALTPLLLVPFMVWAGKARSVAAMVSLSCAFIALETMPAWGVQALRTSLQLRGGPLSGLSQTWLEKVAIFTAPLVQLLFIVAVVQLFRSIGAARRIAAGKSELPNLQGGT